MKTQGISVWTYIGILLTIYGVMLTAGGIYQWIHPPATVLAQDHATFWAGIALLIVGGAYVATYRLRRRSDRS